MIRAFFRNVSSNESVFCGEFTKTFPDGRGVLTKTLHNFVKQKNPHGKQSPAYYAAYVFFEKPRIRDESTSRKLGKEFAPGDWIFQVDDTYLWTKFQRDVLRKRRLIAWGRK